MTSYNFGDVILVEFPQAGTIKKRPALVVLDIGDADIVLAPITTKERTRQGDYGLQDWSTSGLSRKSWVRLAKVACLEKCAINRLLGHLSDNDLSMVVNIWQNLYPHKTPNV